MYNLNESVFMNLFTLNIRVQCALVQWTSTWHLKASCVRYRSDKNLYYVLKLKENEYHNIAENGLRN